MADDRQGRSETRYCSHCGHSLEPSMNYCPNCGTAIERRERSDASRRGARSTDGPASVGQDVDRPARKRLEARIARASRDGWQLERDFGDHAVMVRRTFGDVDEHLVVALLTVWWTMGLGNVLYGAYRYVEDAERTVLWPDPLEKSDREESRSSSHLLERVTAAVCLIAGAILAAIGLQLSAAPVLGLSFLALAVGFVAVGVGALPSVRSRLERRRSVTTNGRIRSVEERSVVAHDRPCSACAEPVGRGLERTYRSEFCLFGVPLTGSAGRNYYCQRCANAEFSSAGTEAGRTGRETVDGASAARSDPSRAGTGRKSDLESGTGPEPEPEHLD
ncbi:zinc ribbon domain-containing protein [Halopiger thermotolerans]